MYSRHWLSSHSSTSLYTDIPTHHGTEIFKPFIHMCRTDRALPLPFRFHCSILVTPHSFGPLTVMTPHPTPLIRQACTHTSSYWLILYLSRHSVLGTTYQLIHPFIPQYTRSLSIRSFLISRFSSFHTSQLGRSWFQS